MSKFQLKRWLYRGVGLLALTVTGCTHGNPAADPALVLTGVSVIDPRTGDVADQQTIVIRGQNIEYVGESPPAAALSNAVVHDHTGHYAMPGLWDMHVHFRGGAELAEENALWLRQYLGFGVTSVRDAGGDLSEEVLAWRNEIERGERRGPRIFTSLQKLDGPARGWPGSIQLSGLEDVAPALDGLQRRGADFVKLYDASLDGRIYLAVIAEAERRGMRTSGHMPLSVPFEAAIETGLDSVEHELYLAKAASADDVQVSLEVAAAQNNGERVPFYETLFRLTQSSDPVKLNRIYDDMIARGAALTPTLHIGALVEGMTDPTAYESDPRLAQVPSGIRATFQDRVKALVQRKSDVVARDLALFESNRALVKVAADRGVIVLAGSDTGAVNSYLYPGDSLHRELEALVDAGLTPLQALRGATLHAADWLGEGNRFGSITPGKVADLIVLERNPLIDISNSRSILAVIQAGVYLDAEQLARLRKLPRDGAP